MLHRTARSRLLLAAFLAAGLVLTSCGPSPAPKGETPQQGITLTDCQLSAPGLSTRLPAKCGSLAVYEDRQAGSGRQIELNLAVIPAVSRNPAPDPLFFLTGGPGEAATESYVQIAPAFTRINQKRDIVLVDQRGTGKSNPLDCSQIDAPEETFTGTDTLTRFIRQCLENQEGNPALYTTPIAIEDLDQVRAALGYETINIYGVSYGTRPAQVYLREYPERVRSVILDGVVPMEETLGIDVARDAQRAVDLILQRCAKDNECHAEFPEIEKEFTELFSRLKTNPVNVALVDPVTGEDTEVTLSDREFASAVRLLSYSQETVAILPLLIHTAAEGDLSHLAAQYLLVSGQLSDSIAEGMGYSVLCSEDWPFFDPVEAEKLSQNTYLGPVQTDALSQICSIWPKGSVPEGYKQAVTSDSPVLLLSGEADPVTPPENGEQVARSLPNSLHLVASGQGHNVIFRGCIPRIIADFVESGATTGLDTTCVQSIQPLPFFINFSGPKP